MCGEIDADRDANYIESDDDQEQVEEWLFYWCLNSY